MSGQHVVKQGEHLSGIAAQYGFRDFATVWSHPDNAALRQARDNAHVLMPGDVVAVPERESQSFERATGQHHVFKVPRSRLLLRLKLERQRAEPFGGIPCVLSIGGRDARLSTQADGGVEQAIAADAVEGTLAIEDRIEGADVELSFDRVIAVRIGHLDPVDTPAGQLARLANLGYYRAAEQPVDDAELHSAIEEFQCDNDLPLSGVCDAQTQAMLKSVHGC